MPEHDEDEIIEADAERVLCAIGDSNDDSLSLALSMQPIAVTYLDPEHDLADWMGW